MKFVQFLFGATEIVAEVVDVLSERRVAHFCLVEKWAEILQGQDAQSILQQGAVVFTAARKGNKVTMDSLLNSARGNAELWTFLSSCEQAGDTSRRRSAWL